MTESMTKRIMTKSMQILNRSIANTGRSWKLKGRFKKWKKLREKSKNDESDRTALIVFLEPIWLVKLLM